MVTSMDKGGFDDTDYSVVVKIRGSLRTRGGGRFIAPVNRTQ